jgi:hypothetical protein
VKVTAIPAVPVYGPPAFATGGAIIVALLVAVPFRLLASVTVNETVYVPPAVYVWLGLTPVPVPPSPKFHAYVSDWPCGSLEPLPLKFNAVPVVPVYGPPALATGGAMIVALLVAVPVKLLASVTVNETVYVPPEV